MFNMFTKPLGQLVKDEWARIKEDWGKAKAESMAIRAQQKAKAKRKERAQVEDTEDAVAAALETERWRKYHWERMIGDRDFWGNKK